MKVRNGPLMSGMLMIAAYFLINAHVALPEWARWMWLAATMAPIIWSFGRIRRTQGKLYRWKRDMLHHLVQR